MSAMKSFYLSLSVLLTNFIVIFIGFNLAVLLGFQLARSFHHRRPPIAKPHMMEAKLYAGGSGRNSHTQIMSETMAIVGIENYVYDEITQLRLLPINGRYVNVEDGGFRHVRRQGPWPLNSSALNVFVFGGSTTFGFFMDEEHTVPSYLQEYARASSRELVNVYNFGRPGYTSTQELLLYLSLLRNGLAPNVAVFIDGLNDCQEWTPTPAVELPWPDSYVYSAIDAQKKGVAYILLSRLPMSRLARVISAGLGWGHRKERGCRPSEVQEFIVNRWLKNKKAIEALSAAYAVKVAFIWQPVAVYKYDLSYDPFGDDKRLASEKYVPLVYPAIEMMGNRGLLGENFLSLAGIQQDNKETLYVDPWHYNETLSGEIASKINRFLRARGMLGKGAAR